MGGGVGSEFVENRADFFFFFTEESLEKAIIQFYLTFLIKYLYTLRRAFKAPEVLIKFIG